PGAAGAAAGGSGWRGTPGSGFRSPSATGTPVGGGGWRGGGTPPAARGGRVYGGGGGLNIGIGIGVVVPIDEPVYTHDGTDASCVELTEVTWLDLLPPRSCSRCPCSRLRCSPCPCSRFRRAPPTPSASMAPGARRAGGAAELWAAAGAVAARRAPAAPAPP